MTPEAAFYHKLMMQAGVSDQYEEYLDRALIEEDPLSDIILALSCCMSDPNQTISVLHQYVLAHDVDISLAASLVWDDLHERYINKKHPLPELRQIMHRVSASTDYCFEEPWYTMAFFDLCWDEVEIGFLNREDFLKTMDDFLMERKTITGPWTYKTN